MKPVLSDRVKKAGTVLSVPVDMIIINQNHPRKQFDERKLNELAVSIRHNGIVQPLLVRIKNENFELISGELRLRAARMLSLDAVPCIVMSVSDEKSILYSLIENIQRTELEFYDEAKAMSTLELYYDINRYELSEKIGKSEIYLNSRIEYYSLSDDIKCLINENNLSESYILSLTKLKTDSERLKFIDYIRENKKQDKISDDNDESTVKKTIIKFNKLNNMRIFINTLNHTVETMHKAGINAAVTQSEQSDCFEYVIRIPKMTSSPVNLVDLSCNVV